MNVWWSAQLFLMLQQYAVLLSEPAAAAGLRLSWHITFREPSVTDGNNREDVHVRKDKEAEEIIEFEEVPDKRQKCISTDWCAARGRRWIKVQLVARVSEQLGNSEVPQRSHTCRLYQAKVAVGCLHHNEINISPFATRQEKFASMWVLQEFSSFKMQVLPGAGERALTHVGPRQTEKAFIGTTRTPPDTSAHF